jgi:hypothetical protein
LITALIGVGYLVAFRGSRPAIVLATFVIVYLIVVSTWNMKAERYLLPTIPPILVLAGSGCLVLLRRLQGLLTPKRCRAAALLILLTMFLPDLTRYFRQVQVYQTDTRTDVAEWLESRVAPGSYIVTEPYGPNIMGPPLLMTLDPGLRNRVVTEIGKERVFAVQSIPMFQTHPNRSAPFYSLELYENADYIIVSSGVASRYRSNPDQFATQISFYNALEQRFERVRDFTPARPGGLRLTAYRPLSKTLPFASRAAVAPPPTLEERPLNAGDAEARFYFELGTNYEYYQHLHEASASYRIALNRGMDNALLFYNCVLGETRCLLAQGRTDDAITFLRAVAAKVSDKPTRTTFTRLADQLSGSRDRRGTRP